MANTGTAAAMTIGEQIVTAARQLIGVKFYHAGRDEKGLDCAGLVLAAWKVAGLTDWDDRNYAPGGDAERLQAGLTRFCERVGPAAPWEVHEDPGPALIAAGDVLLLRMGRQPIHVALATGEGTIIHSLESVGRVVEVPFDHHWQQRVVSIWRWRN